MKRAIITGATGALGMALIQKLLSSGTEVLIFCRRDSKRNGLLPHHPLLKICYCSLQELATVENTANLSYDVFYHFAWEGTTGQARNDMYLQNQNIKYALDAVATAARFGCHTFIGAGSQAEYGRVEGKLSASTPTFPENGYGIAKMAAGMMTREAAHRLGLRHIWTRILSLYGPFDGPQSMVMSTIANLQTGVVPKFTKGEQLWDYLYSGDAADAFYSLGKSGHDGKVYVVGSGTARPLADYIHDIRDVVAPDAPISLGAIPYAPKQVMHLQADITELKQDLGWAPKTDFRTGIQEILLCSK